MLNLEGVGVNFKTLALAEQKKNPIMNRRQVANHASACSWGFKHTGITSPSNLVTKQLVVIATESGNI